MDDPQSLLAEAKAAMERGDDALARRLLDELVSVQPNNEQAWLLLAKVVEHENERSEEKLEERDWGAAPTLKTDYNK